MPWYVSLLSSRRVITDHGVVTEHVLKGHCNSKKHLNKGMLHLNAQFLIQLCNKVAIH